MSRSKYVDIEVYLDEWDDDELIEELNERGYSVEEKASKSEVLDDIFALYKEWMDDQGDRDTRFEKAMRKFFEKHLNKVSA
jgi:deoxyadenosine/deoxycytidine kinase